MQAYQETDLYNKYVKEQALEALQTVCINNESFDRILQAYPSKLYTPNYFIKIALGLLTVVAILFSGLLLALLFSGFSSRGIIMTLILLALLCYFMLELFIKRKQYYNAGVDNMLMLSVVVIITSAFFTSDYQASWLVIVSIILVISFWLCLRFTDAFMAIVSYCCMFTFIFLVYIKGGNLAKVSAPFLMMAVSAITYYLVKNLTVSRSYLYQFCFKAVTLLTLITFYASGNYFIVKELSNQLFPLQLKLNGSIPFGWLFWIFTFTIPLAYIIYGVIKKDLPVMRTGLCLIAATVFTVKYYFTFLTVEIEMLISGMLLIAISYVLIRFLKTPKYGFTSENIYPFKKNTPNIEALIIAETFDKQEPTQN